MENSPDLTTIEGVEKAMYWYENFVTTSPTHPDDAEMQTLVDNFQIYRCTPTCYRTPDATYKSTAKKAKTTTNIRQMM